MDELEQILNLKTTSASKTDYDSGFSMFTLRFSNEVAVDMFKQLETAIESGKKEGGIVVNLSFGKTGNQKYESGDIRIRGKLPRKQQGGGRY